jgi:hypothetical protein
MSARDVWRNATGVWRARDARGLPRLLFNLLLILTLLFSSLGFAAPTPTSQASPQEPDDRYLIRFKTRAFTPARGLELAAIRESFAQPSDPAPAAASDKPYRVFLPLIASAGGAQPADLVHFLIQFEDLPDTAARQSLADAGFNLLTYVTGQTYIASASASRLGELQNVAGVRWVGPLEAGDKIDPDLQAGHIGGWARAADGRVALTVQFHADVSLTDAEAMVKRLGGEVVVSVAAIPSITALFAPGQAQSLAQEDAVQYVAALEPPLGETNDGARVAANVAPLAAAPYNLNGAGVTVLVYDSGILDVGHPDFAGRVLETEAGEDVRNHSTHVAGTVGGSGANSNGNDSAGNPNGGAANQWAGMAPAVNLRSFGSAGSTDVLYDSAGDINANFTTAIGNGVDLATMSLGNNVVLNGFPCAQLGDYTNTAILRDNIVRGSIAGQQLIYFESAGNERQSGAPCGQFSTIGSPATAKNTIAIGAINSNDNTMTGFSSFGPTDDGRLKPDLTAPGCQVGGDNSITSTGFIDTNGNGNLDAGEVRFTYVGMCGTSMATPVTAGATALLVQQWRATRGAGTRPLPHTVKAILVHTATDLGNAGPDYQFGWGALNAQAAVDLVRADDTADLIHVDQVDNGVTDFYTFNSDGLAAVRVSLAWSDPPAARLAAVTLINDLDLRLVDPDGIVYQPFVLNPAQPNNAATTGDDNLNNVEMVVGAAKAGTWTVRVIGDAVPQGPQQYSLITPTDAAANNQPPVADAGGPYATVEGTDVVLNGSGSSDPDGDALTYAWDFDDDGVFDDASGPTPTFTLVGQDGVFPVALRVTDPDGAFDVDATTVTVANVAPGVSAIPNTPVGEGSPVAVNGVVSDPGWLDPLTVTIDWGDGTPVEPVAGALENVRPDATLTFSATHVYGDNGTFTAQVCGSDDDTTTCLDVAMQIDNEDPATAIDESGAVLINGVPTFLAHAGEDLDFHGRATDPGSDDLFLSWDWDLDDGLFPDVTTAYLVNPPNPDPFPSPSVQPRDVTDTQTHAYADVCLYVVTFQALDDDGGLGSDTTHVIVVGNAHRTRSAGYWQHQFHGVGHTDFDADELDCYLLVVGYMSLVFNEVRDASTRAAALDVLFVNLHGGSAIEQFDRQLLAAWLNFANGAVGYDELVDSDGDGHVDTPFSAVMAAAESVRLDPHATRAEIEAQKDILERLNTRDG